jgi:hypothetical protein
MPEGANVEARMSKCEALKHSLKNVSVPVSKDDMQERVQEL